MPFKGFLSSTSPKPRAAVRSAASRLSDAEKLALLEELESTGMGWFWASDEKGILTYLSAAIAQRIEAPLEDLLGKPLASLFLPIEGEGRSKSLALMLGAHKAFQGFAVRAACRSEGGAVLRLAGRPVFDEEGTFCGFRGTGSDITEEHLREQETQRLARYDSLTGLANRHHMAHQIDTTLTAFRAAKRNCAILMLDLDRFKQVNDTLGHAAGDELLKQVAGRLGRAIGRDCTIGRLGGDEFQVMLPDLDDRGVLAEIAVKIIAMLKQPYSLEEGRCVIGASVGIAIAPHDGITREEVVRSADLALYAAKNGGRGQYRFYSGELENEAIFRRRLAEDLGTAVREEQLFLTFEPIVEAASARVSALETHICWRHPERGEIEPEEFAAILEDAARIDEIGQWAIEAACLHALGWPGAVRVAVNVPTALFNSDGFVEEVTRALHRTGLAPERLELEISENAFLGDTEAVDRRLAALFKLGVRLTLDEFGSGYSSLAYLRRAPFDALKIDEKLIAEAARPDAREQGLVKAIVALAGALEMDTIATGIDTPELLKAVSECGVRFVEGAIYAEPVSDDTVRAELTGGTWNLPPSAERKKRARRRTVFRKIHVIHDDHSYEVTLRNLSKSGALIQGLIDVPKGTQFVIDLGGGQLAVATVIRSNGDTQGLEFEQPLIEDGAGGLCTRNRVSPYALAAAGAPLTALAPGSYKTMEGGGLAAAASAPKFGYAPASRTQAQAA
ncbi:MAG: EAL domain-containing protein [Erythrobacter sp.]|nr:EAL domain-containing protein [Erythrobacter sp.]